jgi:asparagine synthase (glutamine-hydrolysing)
VDLDDPLKRLAHRGPDGRDVAYKFNSSLGHTRLAIVDVEGGSQPLHSPDGRKWLICNGEIYNHADLRARNPDYDYMTESDSEVILALYERCGVDAVDQLDGMFAFALIDEDRLLLARDPLGIKPLYFAQDGDVFYFSSEIKALQDLTGDIQEFPNGHWYTPETGFVQYYNIHDVAAEPGDTPVDPRRIRETLEEAVRKRLMSEVPLGVFLSGGLDSSIISALVSRELPNVHSFAVGVEASRDLEFARQVAAHLGTQHHEYIYTVDEMVAALPEIIYHLESFDPSLVQSAIPNYFLTRMASQYVTVVLTGEGADELYAGYEYMKDIGDEDELHVEMAELTGTLHSCNLLRCDRMTMVHGMEARVPFLDTEFIDLSFNVPVEDKIHGPDAVEKWALRKAFEGLLPDEVLWRVKQPFGSGAGSIEVFEQIADREISDQDFVASRNRILAEDGVPIQSKEELYYYRIFRRFFEPSAASLVQPWRGLAASA